MSYIHPDAIEHQRKRWLRHDAYRFAAPGSPEADPGFLHPWAAVARAEEAKAAAEQTEQESLRADLEHLHRLVKDLRIEPALRRLRHKYSPDQPRVPAGNSDGGQWTSGGGAGNAAHPSDSDPRTSDGGAGQQDGRIRLAGDPPVPLQRIHPDTTYESDPEAKRSLNYWRGKSTDEIVESLKPGGKDALTTYPDGRIRDGNTRVKVLQERGYDTGALPRAIDAPTPLTPGRTRRGGSGGPGGLLPFQ